MKKIKKAADIFIPGILLSSVTGCLAGITVYFFKRIASFLSDKSAFIYNFAADRLWAIPLLFAGLFLLSVLSYFILKRCPSSMGGGIPSSIGALRGILNFYWLKTLISTAIAALITFFSGIPLGNEGPSVQMGTSLGKGISTHLGKRSKAWERYIMSAGASGGFAAATFSPLSGILLSLEEAHQRFSPMILFSSLCGAVSASITNSLLTSFFGGQTAFLGLTEIPILSFKYLPIAVIIGIISGVIAVIYSGVYKFFRNITENIPLFAKLLCVFMLAGFIGIIFPNALGNGHTIIELLLNGKVLISYMLILLILKLTVTALASAIGVTGGLFIPILTIGALLGGITTVCLDFLNFDNNIFLPIILISIASFLGSAMKTPFLAIVFSVEALFCGKNVIFVAVAVICGYLITELTGTESISEIVLSFRLEEQMAGEQHSIEMSVTVEADAFAEGKAIRDLFLPPNCVIVSIVHDGKENPVNNGEIILHEKDVLNIHSVAYSKERLENDIASLFKA